ncbi:MAG: hypothetical protein B6229_04135 [Spirochaetaceae bacterium 4572_7]|nr:MAG: hypothetical protein B6229_04135 [Spirochaetaceae bacterium 4572_7]
MKKTNIAVGSVTNGFELLNITDLGEYRSLGLEFIHVKSGLKLFHIYNNDKENTFSFSFNTPVVNSTGVPHIIEHSVLSGSRKYDLKDPFQAMMTGSVNTFLNAYTFPDKTSYPASSILEKDFFNIMSVYGDAVFFPRLKKETFLQEGWRVEVDDDNNLSYSGIVYNEMKGVYSSHDSIVADMSIRALFPDGVYSHDSGGDPVHIPKLTYEEFLDYHKQWYHPSNCYFYLYGDIPTEKTLKFLDENFLSKFSVNTVPNLKVEYDDWVSPVSVHKYTAALEDKENSSDLLMSWRLFDMATPEDGLAIEILHRIILGSSAAPLQKALIDSDLWGDLSSAVGLENELSHFVYTVGVRGASPDKIEQFKTLVLDTLTNIVKSGVDSDLIEGAMRSIEFRNREIQGSFGLRLMRKVIRGWLNGFSPITTLEFEKWMNIIRKKSLEKGYYEGLINKYFLNNNNRADIIIEPSVKEAKRESESIENALLDLKSNLTKHDINRIRNENKKLLKYQNSPDSKVAIDSLPRLTREDIPMDITHIDTKLDTLKGFNLYKTSLYTNGVVYFGIGFNMEYLDKFFFDYMLIFSRMLTQAGFKGVPYDEVSKRVSLTLGGIGTSMETSNTLKNGHPNGYIEHIYIRGKVLEHNIEEGIGLALNFIKDVDFHDHTRLKSIVIEIRNDLKASLVPNGSSYAALRSARKFSLSSSREESWYGLSQLLFLDELVDSFEKEGFLEEVSQKLDTIKMELFTKQGLFFHTSTDNNYDDRVNSSFLKIIDALPKGHGYVHPVEHYDLMNDVEGLVGNSKVSYTGMTIKGAFLGSKEYGAQLILCNILKTGYLWENVRMKGGAYGVFVSPSGLDGAITFGSYRDPNIVSTIEHFRTGLEWVAAGNITQDNIDMALISVIGKELKPLMPFEKSIVGMRRILLGITDSVRKSKRHYLMEVDTKILEDFAAAILHHFDDRSIVILSSKEALDGASTVLEGLTENRVDLPR